MDEYEHTAHYTKTEREIVVLPNCWISNFMDNLGMFSLSGRCFRKEKEEVVAKVEQG